MKVRFVLRIHTCEQCQPDHFISNSYITQTSFKPPKLLLVSLGVGIHIFTTHASLGNIASKLMKI